MNLSTRLGKLESIRSPHVVELAPIPPDSTLEEAMRIYEDNLRRSKEVSQQPLSEEPSLTLEEATRIYKSTHYSENPDL